MIFISEIEFVELLPAIAGEGNGAMTLLLRLFSSCDPSRYHLKGKTNEKCNSTLSQK